MRALRLIRQWQEDETAGTESSATGGKNTRKFWKDSMTEAERMRIFLASLDTGNSEFLDELEKQARQQYVPIIRHETQSVLRVLLTQTRPAEILEVGTAIGFSAILMCENSEAHITTIENYEKRIEPARDNFRKAGVADRVDLIFGDATEVLPTLDGPYDFVFMDAAKGQYIRFLPESRTRSGSCRRAIFSSRTMRSSDGTGRFISACGSTCMS